MPDYRLFFLSLEGHFLSVSHVIAADDADAVGAASAKRGSGPMELWCGPRKVQVWAHDGPQRPDTSL